jgi:hypothetical protein
MIDMQSFCGDLDLVPRSMGKIAAPWSQGDWTYATNGHVMVRVARRADVPAVEGLPNNAAEIFAMGEPPVLTPFGGLDLPPAAMCGEGVACEEGTAVCDTCRSLTLRGGLFDLTYVRLIAGLPALQLERRAPDLGAEIPAFKGQPQLALRFAFGGDEPGEGLLMPLRSRSRHHLDLLEGDLLGAHRLEGGA